MRVCVYKCVCVCVCVCLKNKSLVYCHSRYLAPGTWRRQWHPTPVLLPRKSHGRRSLVGCSTWGCWVRNDWATSLSLFTCMHWRRKWQPTPVFLPGESQGWGSLVGCRLWGRTESDMTEATSQQQQQHQVPYDCSKCCFLVIFSSR